MYSTIKQGVESKIADTKDITEQIHGLPTLRKLLSESVLKQFNDASAFKDGVSDVVEFVQGIIPDANVENPNVGIFVFLFILRAGEFISTGPPDR